MRAAAAAATAAAAAAVAAAAAAAAGKWKGEQRPVYLWPREMALYIGDLLIYSETPLIHPAKPSMV